MQHTVTSSQLTMLMGRQEAWRKENYMIVLIIKKCTQTITLNILYHLITAKRGAEWISLSILFFANSGKDFSKHSTGLHQDFQRVKWAMGEVVLQFHLCELVSHLTFRTCFYLLRVVTYYL